MAGTAPTGTVEAAARSVPALIGVLPEAVVDIAAECLRLVRVARRRGHIELLFAAHRLGLDRSAPLEPGLQLDVARGGVEPRVAGGRQLGAQLAVDGPRLELAGGVRNVHI